MEPIYAYVMGDNNITEVYKRALTELNEFFDLSWQEDLPKLFIVKDRVTINALFGRNTEPWQTGWNWSTKAIFVLDPQSLESESSHKPYENYLYHSVKHELTHAFYTKLTDEIEPKWFYEGLAIYLSGVYSSIPYPPEFHGFLDADKKAIYEESGFVVKLLAEKYGYNVLVDFVKSLRGNKFDYQFRKYFNIEVTYTDINALLGR